MRGGGDATRRAAGEGRGSAPARHTRACRGPSALPRPLRGVPLRRRRRRGWLRRRRRLPLPEAHRAPPRARPSPRHARLARTRARLAAAPSPSAPPRLRLRRRSCALAAARQRHAEEEAAAWRTTANNAACPRALQQLGVARAQQHAVRLLRRRFCVQSSAAASRSVRAVPGHVTPSSTAAGHTRERAPAGAWRLIAHTPLLPLAA